MIHATECCKCGCYDIGTVYSAQNDRLVHYCCRCGYRWGEAPRDRNARSSAADLLRDIEAARRAAKESR